MEQSLTVKKLTSSEKFTAEVMRQFTAEAGKPVAWTEYERALAQHLFLKVDAYLRESETKRQDKGGNGVPYSWENINMRKLALDGVHRINLGLDALIPAHIYPISYFNSKEKKYDIDLRIGYEGELYYKMKHATPKPTNIKCELVYATDKFKAIKEFNRESYELEIVNPFSRGEIIGGFGYVQYEDPAQNKLVLVTMDDIKKSRSCAKTEDFWTKWNAEMILKTVVHRTCKILKTDPQSINASSVAYVESQDSDDAEIEQEISERANKEVIEIDEVQMITTDEETGEITEEGPIMTNRAETPEEAQKRKAGF